MKMITDYKKLLLVSAVFILFCVCALGYNYINTGQIVEKSIDFNGGTIASVIINNSDFDMGAIEYAANDNLDDVVVRTASGNYDTSIIFESENIITQDDITDILDSSGTEYDADDISIQTVGAALGKEFMREAMFAIAIAFVLMGAIIFLTFKSVVPSVAIISAAAVDIIFAMALMTIFNIKLSLGTFAALLLLIGYSVDTDILLTTRLLKRKSEGTLDERIASAMKTGITMTTSAIVAFGVLFCISTSSMLDQIALVIIFGLLADYVTTWFQNVGLLKWHLKKEEKEDEENTEEIKKPKFVRKKSAKTENRKNWAKKKKQRKKGNKR
ncbi:MAG: protein translocase subunit SecF [archaeon]|nr:protein translocase subunit SecF [archaeon]